MKRRGFLTGMILAGMAPAIIKAEILMPVRKIVTIKDVWSGSGVVIDVERTVVTAPSRVLKARYSMEMEQDMRIYHGLDIEEELIKICRASNIMMI